MPATSPYHRNVTHVSKLRVGHEATNGGGDTSFTCAGTVGDLIPGQKVTATASNTSGTATGTAIGDTSEFSKNVLVS